ncbi:hypothetical protein BC937DRAFT_93498 [Endogone sp. FLAS-F59071]|nr:hypothetical protein BC937DRAFT_93498 [Endogone sp. FLAS-F59071]|eukprot:RUS14657.1 hypothetical protein BC937DRAFT_93498 [Endogone sp. FLAS-F59071]
MQGGYAAESKEQAADAYATIDGSNGGGGGGGGGGWVVVMAMVMREIESSQNDVANDDSNCGKRRGRKTESFTRSYRKRTREGLTSQQRGRRGF